MSWPPPRTAETGPPLAAPPATTDHHGTACGATRTAEAIPEPPSPTTAFAPPAGRALSPPPPAPVGWIVRAGVPIVGAHGGSGATTVATFLAAFGSSSYGGVAAYDAGRTVPPVIEGPGVVVTARATPAGAAAAQRTVAAIRSAHPASAVVVLVTEDGPWPLPPIVRARLRALSGAVAEIVRLPYVARWRFVDKPSEVPPRYTAQLQRAWRVIGAEGTTSDPRGQQSRR